jgi:hypothetical protein
VSEIISTLIFKMSMRSLFRSPRDALPFIYSHNQVEIGGDTSFQIFG